MLSKTTREKKSYINSVIKGAISEIKALDKDIDNELDLVKDNMGYMTQIQTPEEEIMEAKDLFLSETLPSYRLERQRLQRILTTYTRKLKNANKKKN